MELEAKRTPRNTCLRHFICKQEAAHPAFDVMEDLGRQDFCLFYL
jgi:hypothetical protein